MIDLEKRHELTKLLIACAKERMKDCPHLDIGNYVSAHLGKILLAQWQNEYDMKETKCQNP